MTGEGLKCSFCNKQQAQVKKLIKGLETNICDECINHFTVSVERPMKIFDGYKSKCSFCGRTQRNENDIFYEKNGVYICYECLDLCRQILE